jgi:hypothetical protein
MEEWLQIISPGLICVGKANSGFGVVVGLVGAVGRSVVAATRNVIIIFNSLQRVHSFLFHFPTQRHFTPRFTSSNNT